MAISMESDYPARKPTAALLLVLSEESHDRTEQSTSLNPVSAIALRFSHRISLPILRLKGLSAYRVCNPSVYLSSNHNT